MVINKKFGNIECECGNNFSFISPREEIPCMKCGKMHKNEGVPVPELGEEEAPEEGD